MDSLLSTEFCLVQLLISYRATLAVNFSASADNYLCWSQTLGSI